MTLSRMTLFREALIPMAAIIAILMLVIPVPPALLDMFLILNMGFAVALIILTLSVSSPLELGSFPTLLLLATLFRLALEVTATRLILTRADAGNVIATFGHLVVGGSLVVGLIIFLILIIIQFLVITRGAERVSEVAARFTLDAMPGKQMAVDQELNSGHLSEAQARAKREAVEQEADFYGAMDGASKFVRGDAIAGLIIVAINLIGGMVIGLVQSHMSIGTAASTYSVLTIGEGLTTQIPALLLSTATGFLVTRSGGGRESAAQAITQQLTRIPRVFYFVGLIFFLLAVLGIPPLMPLVFGALLIGFGYWLDTRQRQQADTQAQQEAARKLSAAQPAQALAEIGVDRLELQVGVGLAPLIGGTVGQGLRDRMAALRHKAALERGLMLPPIRVRDNLDLPMYGYQIRVRGGLVAEGLARSDRLMAMGGDLTGIPHAEKTQDPIFGTAAMWIMPDARARAELTGATVIDAPTILVTHLAETIKRHGWELLSRESTKLLVEHVRKTNATVVNELVPELLSMGEVQQVLQQLLRENISIRDLPTILEALADRARNTRDLDQLTESARQAINRAIIEPYLVNGALPAITLAPQTEQQLAQALVATEGGGRTLVLPPDVATRWMERIKATLESANTRSPVLLTAPLLRYYVRRFLERTFPNLPVMAYSELPQEQAIRTVGQIVLDEP